LRRESSLCRPLRLRFFAAFAALVVCAFGCVGCGYHVAGRAANLPSSWHTIAIPAFINRTPTYRIEQRVTNAVVHEFLARTKYRIVPNVHDADAVLHGEITDIETTPLLFDAQTGHVTAMLVTIKLKVMLQDETTQKTVYENNNFVFRDEYQLSGDVTKFFQEENPAMDRMSRDFAKDLVSTVLEGF
jgi:hypothetical protein